MPILETEGLTRPEHHHIEAPRVAIALAITLLAAAGELAGARSAGSLFLTADAVHLVAHIGIFAVLLIPRGRWHGAEEDVATAGVLALVALIATAITAASINAVLFANHGAPAPAFLLLSLLGLGANVATAWLFRTPAASRWSFRAALAHELADGMITVAGLAGALLIRLFGWWWIDPGLSLAIGVWLDVWALRLVRLRIRHGASAWTIDDGV
jgi:cobalt-zinc-cadmium efflux system protein